MRQSQEVKAETHQAIIEGAARLFRERGIGGTSVGDVMDAAARTHGGFYRHFDSKESLLVAALEKAFADMVDTVNDGMTAGEGARSLAQFITYYLSPRMVADVGGGCPVAALSGDVRLSSDAVRAVFGSGAMRIITTIADTLDGPADERMRRAGRAFAMAAGALMIARASDPETARFMLAAAGGE